MKFRLLTITIPLILSIAVTVPALPPISQQGKSAIPSLSATIDETHFLNANNILMFVTNYGSFARDLAGVFGNDYGTYYPYTSVADIISGANVTSPLYAAGLWLGGKVNGEIRVTVAEYSSEFVPGPMAGGTYQIDRPEFRIYKLYKDSLAANPNADYTNWPVSQGAPTNPDGTPAMLGDQMIWTVFNDANPSVHDNDASSTTPLGIEVQLTTWAYNQSGSLDDLVFLRYLILNNGPNGISDMYISLWSDPDLGGAGDDLVGCDTLKQIWFCYNGDNVDTQYGNKPPAIGFQVQAGPIVPSPGDTAILNGIPRPNYTNLGISSFNAYENGTDPNDYTETYNYMQGLRADGSVYQYNGTPTKFVYSGDPVTRIGDLDSNPADRRMMASFGPFTFLPGDTQQLATQMGVAQGGERLSSITLLRFLFDSQSPPPPSCCTGIRGNVTGDPNNQIDIADLIFLVQYLFMTGPPPACVEEGDVSGDGITDIADLVWLVTYMFKDGPAPVSCQ